MSLNRDDFLKVLSESNLLTVEQLDSVDGDSRADADPRATARRVVQRGWLTPWQAQQLLAGRSKLFLGKYKLLQALGQGGMGAVFQAEQPSLKRIVAIKVMARHVLSNRDAVNRFLREIRTVAALDHPHIVSAYDADCAAQTYFLVMEYVPGIDLKRWIAQHGRLPIGWSCEVVRQAALGLQHAHEHGLVHRDIKPANLLIVQPHDVADAASVGPIPGRCADAGSVGHGHAGGVPRVKILDLGLARFASDVHADASLTNTGQIMGTPDYIAPEQAENTRRADIRADIYSLGCTLFEMLTGSVPFAGEAAMQKVLARINGTAPRVRSLRPDVPALLDEIVARMMSRDPSHRQQTPSEIVRQLEPFALSTSPQSTQQTLLLEPDAPLTLTAPTTTAASVDERPDTTLDGFLGALGSQAAATPVPAATIPATASRPRRRNGSKQAASQAVAAAAVVSLALAALVAWGIGGGKRRAGDTPPSGANDAADSRRPASNQSAESREPPAFVGEGIVGQVWKGNSLEMPFCWCPGGLGNADGDVNAMLPGFWMGQYEVTRGEYLKLTGERPSQARPGAGAAEDSSRLPVDSVNFDEAAAFCRKFTEAERAAGMLPRNWEYRLPTEPEWNHACMATRIGFYTFGDDGAELEEYAWIDKNSDGTTHPVGQKRPSRWGLYDVHGNVAEWCIDWRNDPRAERLSPAPPQNESITAVRGGGFRWTAAQVNMSDRPARRRTDRLPDLGFRVILAPADFGRTLPEDTEEESGDFLDQLASDKWTWTPLENLGRQVNSSKPDRSPTVTADGLLLVFSSQRGNGHDLYECVRTSEDEPFGPATALTTVNSPDVDESPFVAADGRTLVFSSRRSGSGDGDLYVSRRASRRAPWGTPERLSDQVNSKQFDSGPQLSPDALMLVFHSNRNGGSGGTDLWMSRRESLDSDWGPAVNLGPDVNSSDEDRHPVLTPDGKGLLFLRGNENVESVRFARLGRNRRWNPFAREIRDVEFLRMACLSPDGKTAYVTVASQGRGGVGDHDLWRTRRVRKQASDAPAPASAALDGDQAKAP